jgi:hypothetical protein
MTCSIKWSSLLAPFRISWKTCGLAVIKLVYSWRLKSEIGSMTIDFDDVFNQGRAGFSALRVRHWLSNEMPIL